MPYASHPAVNLRSPKPKNVHLRLWPEPDVEVAAVDSNEYVGSELWDVRRGQVDKLDRTPNPCECATKLESEGMAEALRENLGVVLQSQDIFRFTRVLRGRSLRSNHLIDFFVRRKLR